MDLLAENLNQLVLHLQDFQVGDSLPICEDLDVEVLPLVAR